MISAEGSVHHSLGHFQPATPQFSLAPSVQPFFSVSLMSLSASRRASAALQAVEGFPTGSGQSEVRRLGSKGPDAAKRVATSRRGRQCAGE